jgi:hypothetical protein
VSVRALALLAALAAGCAFDAGGLSTTDGGVAGGDAAATDGGDVSPTDGGDVSPPDARVPDARPPDASVPDATPRCVGYQAIGGGPASSRYRKVNEYTAWLVARDDCASDGGYLVVPDTAAEAVAVFDFVGPGSGSPFYFTGISNPERDATWTTVLGTQQVYLPWAPGQPNGRSGEIYALVSATGEFYDFFDNATQEYACECNP